MSDPLDNPDQLVITRQLAAQAIMNYFLVNAEAGNHAANDELIAELARQQRERYEGRLSGEARRREPGVVLFGCLGRRQ